MAGPRRDAPAVDIGQWARAMAELLQMHHSIEAIEAVPFTANTRHSMYVVRVTR